MRVRLLKYGGGTGMIDPWERKCNAPFKKSFGNLLMEKFLKYIHIRNK